ncbi:murein transglycosylase A [Acuticoccus sp. I52.16.1]|uniref:MltA domain-containing protein n=1 Tax=Acuticoccus sp. I52.16.1 TaxID=2928472 RepID=UPI001FD01BF3|nr:murein transglycosylase A [Acuticoccus sp. I52.16.1]UOM36458.1 murein transglycosylase A [Acuticoccus sp. I52.16.1]
MDGPAFPIPIAGLPGWSEAEAEALLAGLARHLDPGVLTRPAQAAWLGALAPALARRGRSARRTVEEAFLAWRLPEPGFLTAYYEPVVGASRRRAGPFQTPLHRRPPDLIRVSARPDLPGDGTWARRRSDGTLAPYPDRAAIRAGALDGLGLDLAFVADPVDAFFAQVQGSARLRFVDGDEMRVGYHGKTGHPYTAIGRVLIDRGWLPEGGATMQSIRAVLAAHPQIVAETLEANRSYVFFRERPLGDPALGPVAAGGVPLVPYRSLAVDRVHHGLGTPIHIATTLPGEGDFAAVMIAEDAGSAIVGRGRGDIFIGTGDAAGAVAGAMKAPATWTVFLPHGVAPHPVGSAAVGVVTP